MTRTTTTPFDIEKVEKKYNATYVGDFPTKRKTGGWGSAGAVFYDPNPDLDKGHKSLFGLFFDFYNEKAVIYDATYLEGRVFTGVMLNDGEYLWSRDVHDYREVPGGAIDGGFDYARVIGDVKVVNLTIKKGKVVEACL